MGVVNKYNKVDEKNLIYFRIYKGWDPIDALLTPKGNNVPNKESKIYVIPEKYILLNKYNQTR